MDEISAADPRHGQIHDQKIHILGRDRGQRAQPFGQPVMRQRIGNTLLILRYEPAGLADALAVAQGGGREGEDRAVFGDDLHVTYGVRVHPRATRIAHRLERDHVARRERFPQLGRARQQDPAPEGAVASPWPLALSTALFAGVSAPFFVAIGKGRDPVAWEVSERSMHVIVPGVTAFAGALLPYLPALAPRNARAARELQKLQIGAPPQGAGAFATFTTTF